MELVRTIAEAQALRARWAAAGERVALVPTMGNLHAGHLSLVEQATARADRVIVTIFVNPLQFAPGEDFDDYPRTLEADLQALSSIAGGAPDLVFAPSVAEIYPDGAPIDTQVVVGELAHRFCGEFREGHFIGACTVVTLLFNVLRPQLAIFGRKDFQQLLVFQRMSKDLHMGVDVIGGDTVREPDGLALSSRNQYLSAEERAAAPTLYRCLQTIAEAVRQGPQTPDHFAALEGEAGRTLVSAGFEPQFIRVLNADLAEPVADQRAYHVIAAAKLGRARLIDNISVELA